MKTIKNNDKRLKITKIYMTCDDKNPSIPTPLENYNFFSIIVGGAGSGKTNLLINLIAKKNKFYYKKFDTIILWSPSLHTLKNPIPLREDHIYNYFDIEDVNKELEKINIEDNKHTLFIFDDFATEFKKNLKPILKLIYNRRHYNLSIFIISQKWRKIPEELRISASSVYFFNIDKRETKDIYDDVIKNATESEFKNICKFVFKDKYNFIFYKKDNGEFYKNFDKIIL